MDSPNNTARVRIHRFRDHVGVYVVTAEGVNRPTFYLSQSLAQQLSESLAVLAKDIREVPKFSESKAGDCTCYGVTS